MNTPIAELSCQLFPIDDQDNDERCICNYLNLYSAVSEGKAGDEGRNKLFDMTKALLPYALSVAARRLQYWDDFLTDPNNAKDPGWTWRHIQSPDVDNIRVLAEIGVSMYQGYKGVEPKTPEEADNDRMLAVDKFVNLEHKGGTLLAPTCNLAMGGDDVFNLALNEEIGNMLNCLAGLPENPYTRRARMTQEQREEEDRQKQMNRLLGRRLREEGVG